MNRPRSNCQRRLWLCHMARALSGASTSAVPRACTASRNHSSITGETLSMTHWLLASLKASSAKR
ncbi:MAG: hypothetical protein ACK5V9_14065 [Burkholderiales bacterium]|jgi:hypothetical protein